VHEKGGGGGGYNLTYGGVAQFIVIGETGTRERGRWREGVHDSESTVGTIILMWGGGAVSSMRGLANLSQ